MESFEKRSYNHGIINWDISRGSAISDGIVTSLKKQSVACFKLPSQVFLYPHKSPLPPPTPTIQCWSLGVGLTSTSHHVCEPTLYGGGGEGEEEEDNLTVQNASLLRSDIVASCPNVIIP